MKPNRIIAGQLRRTFLTFPAVLAMFLFSLALGAMARDFTATDGNKLSGDVISATDDTVVIKVGTKHYTVPISRFVEADQKYIAEWRTAELKTRIPKLDVKINPGVNNRQDKGGDFDDRKGSFDFVISVENREQGYELKDATGQLVVLGEDAGNDDRYAVMQVATMKFSAAAGKTATWQGEEVRYKFDDSGSVKGGYKYYAYLFMLKNSDGSVIYTKASQTKLERAIEDGMKLKHRDITDKTLKKASGSASTYYF